MPLTTEQNGQVIFVLSGFGAVCLWLRNSHCCSGASMTPAEPTSQVYLLEELLSPIVTPFMILRMRSRALDIVDFLHHFTVEVPGVGDVCSFAEMDVRRHGSPTVMRVYTGEGAACVSPTSA